MLFTGSGVALVTPFLENGEVDYQGIDQLVDFHLANNTQAIIAMGTTGEASTTSDPEQINGISRVVKRVAGRIPVIAGTGINHTTHAIELSVEAEKVGADGLLLVTPYYNKATKRGLYEHYKLIAESVKIPSILYTVPSRTAVEIPVNMVKELSEIKNIVGIKDASGDLSYTAAVRHAVPKDFAIYSGNDDVVVPLMSLGGQGVISVIANILPVEIHQMTQACLAGDFSTAADIQIKLLPLIQALFKEVNPVPVKAALELLDLPGGGLRLPLTRAEVETVDNLRKCLIDLDYL
ncbi:MAG TPA: 4-hydroxy-tetrahydrodipicolinate synthase [Candidatus Eisenbacteria bacterium]|nr:4-hydroxy-tetrahydrodipicolinate synthase [Candidatus Eisenbacteria bacterium]